MAGPNEPPTLQRQVEYQPPAGPRFRADPAQTDVAARRLGPMPEGRPCGGAPLHELVEPLRASRRAPSRPEPCRRRPAETRPGHGTSGPRPYRAEAPPGRA